MVSIVVVDKNRSLEDVVVELRRQNYGIFRAGGHGAAMQHIYNQIPSAILIDEDVKTGVKICRDVRAHGELTPIRIFYFIRNEERIDQTLGVNHWYIKGSYTQSEVVHKIKQFP